ncbi:hypothetical protein BD413DRAFT_666078 [Trametes elegans]|nr:hypothetical protein BD413DRAFT_666078 [Trametes elegans]
MLADGRRAAVHRAPLVATLGPRGSGAPPRTVAVAAKTAKGCCRAHFLLRQEGAAYTALPPALSAIPGSPQAETGEGEGATPGPVVPRFYGLYVPVDAKGRVLSGRHAECDGYVHADCAVEWPSPILLMEDCGVPVDLARMPKAHRQECWSLVDRMHQAGVTHGSAHPRNVLVQPGPLSAPRPERTLATPSFRIASLGRAEVLRPRPGPPTRLAVRTFEKAREVDVQTALSALRLWEEE